jgi:hypothetical protein
MELSEILGLFAAGRYWPALALLLLGLTHLVRRGFFDRWLAGRRRRRARAGVRGGVGPVRALVPVALAGAAWAICVALPLDVSATEAAYTALLGALGAMGIHDTGKASAAILRPLAARTRSTGATITLTEGTDMIDIETEKPPIPTEPDPDDIPPDPFDPDGPPPPPPDIAPPDIAPPERK